MNRTELLALAERACAVTGPKVLRFSECSVPGGRGYQWGSVRTSSIDIMRFLCACWNNRAVIADALRAQQDDQP
jgi:hypothetical protein